MESVRHCGHLVTSLLDAFSSPGPRQEAGRGNHGYQPSPSP